MKTAKQAKASERRIDHENVLVEWKKSKQLAKPKDLELTDAQLKKLQEFLQQQIHNNQVLIHSQR